MLIKTKKEISQIKSNGQLIGEILMKLRNLCRPGLSTLEIDRLAEKMIGEAGGEPAFKGYKNHPAAVPFPTTICASINKELVHGIARRQAKLKEGDIFSIDIGMKWPAKAKGVYTDTAITFAIGNISPEIKKLLAVTKEALAVGIKAAKPGRSVAVIGRAIENYVKAQGAYAIVRDLVGHGVGHAVHEEPHVPNFYDPKLEKVILKPGMVIAIEAMLALGTDYRVKTKSDGWTIEMMSGELCAHFEHTVIITEKGNIVATRRPKEDEEII